MTNSTDQEREAFALIPVERSYDMRAAAILHFNTARKAGADLDDALDSAWRATLAKAHRPDDEHNQQPSGVVLPEAAREAVCDAISEALGDAYDCTRVWAAWGVGTMGQDDFNLITDDSSRVGELADAAIAAMFAAAPHPVSESAEDRFEHYLQNAIDNAPDPLRRLGEYLSHVIDEDEWATAERMLNGAIVAASAHPVSGEPFQARVVPWLLECFGQAIANDKSERNHRFLEEALELVQSCGCTEDEAHKLVAYVYGRAVGERSQEVGGVMVTLAALCLAQRLDMHQCGETELARVTQPAMVEKIREKQKRKPSMSPLPGSYGDREPFVAPPAAQDVAGDVLAEWIEHGPSKPCPFTHPYSSKVDIRLRDGTEKLGELACNVTWFWYAHEHRDYHVVAYRPAAHRAQQGEQP